MVVKLTYELVLVNSRRPTGNTDTLGSWVKIRDGNTSLSELLVHSFGSGEVTELRTVTTSQRDMLIEFYRSPDGVKKRDVLAKRDVGHIGIRRDTFAATYVAVGELLTESRFQLTIRFSPIKMMKNI